MVYVSHLDLVQDEAEKLGYTYEQLLDFFKRQYEHVCESNPLASRGCWMYTAELATWNRFIRGGYEFPGLNPFYDNLVEVLEKGKALKGENEQLRRELVAKSDILELKEEVIRAKDDVIKHLEGRVKASEALVKATGSAVARGVGDEKDEQRDGDTAMQGVEITRPLSVMQQKSYDELNVGLPRQSQNVKMLKQTAARLEEEKLALKKADATSHMLRGDLEKKDIRIKRLEEAVKGLTRGLDAKNSKIKELDQLLLSSSRSIKEKQRKTVELERNGQKVSPEKKTTDKTLELQEIIRKRDKEISEQYVAIKRNVDRAKELQTKVNSLVISISALQAENAVLKSATLKNTQPSTPSAELELLRAEVTELRATNVSLHAYIGKKDSLLEAQVRAARDLKLSIKDQIEERDAVIAQPTRDLAAAESKIRQLETEAKAAAQKEIEKENISLRYNVQTPAKTTQTNLKQIEVFTFSSRRPPHPSKNTLPNENPRGARPNDAVRVPTGSRINGGSVPTGPSQPASLFLRIPNTDPIQPCENCHMPSHSTLFCLAPCGSCGSKKHQKPQCEKDAESAVAPTTTAFSCYNCGGQGHVYRECRAACGTCGSEGHKRLQCLGVEDILRGSNGNNKRAAEQEWGGGAAVKKVKQEIGWGS